MTTKRPNLGRHKRTCSVCGHEKREEIEAEFVSWRSPAAIAQQYGLADRASVYRHAHALGLFDRRHRNVRAALERIIEQAGEVEVNASAVVSAIQAYSKINTQGQWIERSETVNLNELFDRMTREELEVYARDGKLPAWFPGEGGTGDRAKCHVTFSKNKDSRRWKAVQIAAPGLEILRLVLWNLAQQLGPSWMPG